MSIARRIEKLQRDFLWGGLEEEHKFHLVNWQQVCTPLYGGAWELWSMVLILFGITWVMPRGVVDLLNCWHGPRSKSEAGKIWKMTPHCLMWCIWQERNDRTFNGEEKSIPALKFHLLHILLSWAKAAHLDSSCSLSDMIDYCSVCL
uniref:Reverse transcriptase zinc-binding domain-containing protein n=1 Tax=Fagus sylvatica TaxID=28930 RepID=A0A2N9IA09_FAGSY